MLNAQYFSPDLSMELFPTLLNLKCNLKLIQIIFATRTSTNINHKQTSKRL